MKVPKFHRVTIGSLTRDLPVREVVPGKLSVAYFNIQCDIEVTMEAALHLANRTHETGAEVFVMPEGKATPLLQQIGLHTGRAIVVAHKKVRPVMRHPVMTYAYESITSGPQLLCLDADEVEQLRGKKVAIVDDVVSTGGTLDALKVLLKDTGAQVVAVMAVFTEGDRREDVIALGHLPLFPH